VPGKVKVDGGRGVSGTGRAEKRATEQVNIPIAAQKMV